MSIAYARASAEGPWSTLALHTIGWKAFQDLCAQVCQEVLNLPVETFSEASDAGQDAVFVIIDKVLKTQVGSVQCKFTSNPQKRLVLSDLKTEMQKVALLVKDGMAHTYVLMTNASISAPAAAQIRKSLFKVGVKKPHVLGRDFLIRAIANSPKLRALVPQVYGLGDISRILDQRIYDQTRLVLGHWLSRISTYVPTKPHRQAVEALTKYNAVLLLGNPSVGKSAIGAILSTLAAATGHETVLSVVGPKEFMATWNPHDPKRFFWIDDAFGPNVLRDDYVQDWAAAFQRVQIAINNGNRFLFTSRRHIYLAAKRKLGQRNLTMFHDETAVVDVGDLTLDERKQILYNHIALGNQPKLWKTKAKPFLEAVAQAPEFLPGIAERLGNPIFTKGVIDLSRDLLSFMRAPKTYLIETIESLDQTLQAALFGIYVHGGRLTQEAINDDASKMISEVMGVSLAEIASSLPQLEGSFIRRLGENFPASWTFAHPTMSDAITDIVRVRPELIAAFVGGAPLATILDGFICEGVPAIKDAGVIPRRLFDLLILRIGSADDEDVLNRRSFSFLSGRATDEFITSLVEKYPEFLSRQTWFFSYVNYNPKVRLFARLNALGKLPVASREYAVRVLEAAAMDDFDIQFFSDHHVIGLFNPSEALQLGLKLALRSVPKVEAEIENIGSNADIDEDPSNHFENYSSGFDLIEEMIGEGKTIDAFESGRSAITNQIDYLEQEQERKAVEEEEKRRWGNDENEYYGRTASTKGQGEKHNLTSRDNGQRSMFDDVDEMK